MISSLFKKLRQSLATRLLLLFLLISLLVTALLVGSLFHAFSSQWRSSIAPHIEQYLDYVNKDLGYPPSRQRANKLADTLPINIYVEGPGTSFSTNGRTLDVEDLEFKRGRRFRKQDQSKTKPQVYIGEHHERTVLKNQTGEYSIYYELQHREANSRRKGALLIPVVILGFLLCVCYLLLRRMLRPVQDIQTAVGLMGAGKLDTRVSVKANNDLGVLAGSINTMASDIEKLLDAKRQLLLGASHELRTPITRAKVAADMLEESANRTRIIEDLDEMESLITDIMESERVTGGHSALSIAPVDINELIKSVAQDLKGSAISTDFSSQLPTVEADATRLRLLFRNLINNALEHGAGELPPLVTTSGDASSVSIRVTDYGEGIATEHLGKLTEPFYRTDPSRARQTGGFGLGLHICDLIVQAHGGSMKIETDDGIGVRVIVQLKIKL